VSCLSYSPAICPLPAPTAAPATSCTPQACGQSRSLWRVNADNPTPYLGQETLRYAGGYGQHIGPRAVAAGCSFLAPAFWPLAPAALLPPCRPGVGVGWGDGLWDGGWVLRCWVLGAGSADQPPTTSAQCSRTRNSVVLARGALRSAVCCFGAVCCFATATYHLSLTTGPLPLMVVMVLHALWMRCYGWIPHNASFGFLDRPPAILGQIYF
jgi:hypothetical protein